MEIFVNRMISARLVP